MKRIIISFCIIMCVVSLCGCSKVRYTYMDIPENAGFEMKYTDGKMLYIDYDLLFKIELPNNPNFVYSYDYEIPAMAEGAPIGRTTLTIYYREQSEKLERNVIEIISTQIGTREHEEFNETRIIEILKSEQQKAKPYLISEYADGVGILSENIGELYCIKADLSKNAYHDLRGTLEDMICSIEALEEDDPYFQEFASRFH